MRTSSTWAIAALWFTSCSGSPGGDVVPPPPAGGTPVADVPAVPGRQAQTAGLAAPASESDDPPLGELPIDLGPGVVLDHFRPGHFAMVARWHQFSSCSRSYSDYQAQTSLVLELREGGVAHACRGREVNEVGGSRRGGGRNTMHMLERQGFAGRWRREGAWVDIQLELDDGPCPQRRGYTNLEPKPWHLRCLAVRPSSHPVLPRAALICKFGTPIYSEGLGYEMTDVVRGEWVLLGGGMGLVVEWDDDGSLGARRANVRVATRPIGHDAWEQPFPK